MNKHFTLFLWSLLTLFAVSAVAQPNVNLTPLPKEITEGDGHFVFSQGVTIAVGNLSDSVQAEATKFAEALNTAAGLDATVTTGTQGDITLSADASCADEGYKLDITTTGITLSAATPTGFFYGFQSIKKMMPANVMAGVSDESVTEYTVPVVSINDEPRFGYRGFMLDVSRHFFTVEEVKRMIDIMAAYKMNAFHWHLTDDQGWRIEINKYPKLTSVGSIRSNSWTVDMDYGDYWTNEQYGPYYYTQEEIADVVEYCHERHIKVIPEIEMPGHAVAAMVSYPEYSCTPNASRSVWINGGISSDVLNVANDDAVQFVKDILDEVMDLFPDGYIHIGGDECPTTAWQNNSECQALYESLGLTSYRQLQSRFIKEISDHIATRGYKLIMWNESITASGADTDMMQQTGATVMSRPPCQSSALQAAQLGMNNIITEYHSSTGGYYINRKQWSGDDEPTGAGSGDDTVEGCYNYVPVPTSVPDSLLKYYSGVQGTFWCEHVANRKYMEYLALPRLMAVAEAGWSPQAKKDFDDFRQRMMADTVMLNYNGYNYGRHSWASLNVDTVMPEEGQYYRIVTRATDGRSGRCMELLRGSSPLVSTYSGNSAQANRLWTNTQAAEGDDAYNYQLWTFVEDPGNPGYYAIVNKAAPRGSVNPTPTATSTSGRWDYDVKTVNYSFLLGEAAFGSSDSGYYYTLRSANTSGQYMNASMSGQGYAVNLYSDPTSGNGGIWTLVPEGEGIVADDSDFDAVLWGSLPMLAENDTIRLTCAVEGKQDIVINDETGQSYLRYTTDGYDNSRWVALNVSTMDSTYTQTCQLYNPDTKRYISSSTSSQIDKIGYPVKVAAAKVFAGTVSVTYQPETEDYQLVLNGYNFYPVSATSTQQASTICSGSTVTDDSQAIRPQGAAWLGDNISLPNVKDITASDDNSIPPKRIYNLSGQAVNSVTTPGVYIVNGEKRYYNEQPKTE